LKRNTGPTDGRAKHCARILWLFASGKPRRQAAGTSGEHRQIHIVRFIEQSKER
jgi:hypothetical protein